MDEYNNQNQWPDKRDDRDQTSSPDSRYGGSSGWQNSPDNSPQGGQWQNSGSGSQWQDNQPGGQWQNNGPQWQGSQPGGQWQDNNSQWQNNQSGGQWQNNGPQWQGSQPGGQWQNQPYGQPPQRNGQALASMIFGILALVSCCIPFVQFPLAVVAIVLVILSKKKRPLTGFAIAGLVLGIISVICSICMTIYLGYVLNLLNDPEFLKLYQEMMELSQ